MKRILPFVLILCMVFAGCAKAPAETEPSTSAPTVAPTSAPTTAPTAAPTTAPTTAPTQPPVVYTNPLTGEEIDKPYSARPVAVTINNIDPALPHFGVNDADLYFEMLCNDYATRGLAVYADPSNMPSVGSVRSARFNHVDICLAYNAVLYHAHASQIVMNDIYENIDNVDAFDADCYYRDQGRLDEGYAWEHCLFTTSGEDVLKAAKKAGYDMTQKAGTSYGLHFAKDGTPVGGEKAETVSFDFWGKMTYMIYDKETGKYGYREYSMDLYDGVTGEREAFTNVFVIRTDVYNEGVYHVADLLGSGDGYYACGGKIIPMKWHHENATDPFTFTLENGDVLVQGVGNSYIGVVPMSSNVEWE